MGTHTKICTEITHIVVFRKKLLKFLQGGLVIYIEISMRAIGFPQVRVIPHKS